jgi:hypothetical protein
MQPTITLGDRQRIISQPNTSLDSAGGPSESTKEKKKENELNEMKKRK